MKTNNIKVNYYTHLKCSCTMVDEFIVPRSSPHVLRSPLVTRQQRTINEIFDSMAIHSNIKRLKAESIK